MIIRFTVENLLSFKERQTFSLLPGKGRLKSEHKTDEVNGISALKTSVIFGANASGKSNLIKSIGLGKRLVLMGTEDGQRIDYQKFRLDSNYKQGNSRLEYEIQHRGKNYAYGFVFNKEEIAEEWLYELTKKDEKLVFSRNQQTFDMKGLLVKNKKKEEQQFLEFTAKATPNNQLFLHEVGNRKIKENVSDISDLLNVLDWFLNALKVVLPEDKYNMGLRFELKDDEKLLKSFEELLRYFDTGISGVRLQSVREADVELPSGLLEIVKKELSNRKSEEVRASLLSVDKKAYFLTYRDGEIDFQKFMTIHQPNEDGEELFDTYDESDGTNRILDFIPLLIDLLEGGNVFVIDEMERSLHPNLIYDLLDLYLSKSKNVNSQLILASHESCLLTQKLLRKDEVWFTVKGKDGATRIHSLEEYNVRFDKNIRKDYLRGRFRAIPKIGNRNNLTVMSNN